jgi:hypothetical protein
MLKTRLREVDEEMEKLTSNERLSADKVVELVDLLRVEVSRNDENGRAMECIEVGALHCTALLVISAATCAVLCCTVTCVLTRQCLKGFMFTFSTFDLKLLLHHLLSASNLITNATSTASLVLTVLSQQRHLSPFILSYLLSFLSYLPFPLPLSLPSLFFYLQQNLLSSSQEEAKTLQSKVASQDAQLQTLENIINTQKSPVFPTQEVLQDLETVLKIKVLESFKSELQIENDSLLAKYKSKSQRVEELTAQTVALKGELDAREADFIVFQSRNGVDAADKVRDIVA